MEQFIAFINETIEKLRVEEKQLAESHRKDEANLARIKMNIYDICKTVYGVCARTPAKNGTNAEEWQNLGKWQATARYGIVTELKQEVLTAHLYLKKVDDISKNWVESYEKAKEHGDVQKQVIEETKLKAVEEIKAKFLELCGQ